MGKLPAESVATVENVVNNYAAYTNPYMELKQHLCRAYGRTNVALFYVPDRENRPFPDNG